MENEKSKVMYEEFIRRNGRGSPVKLNKYQLDSLLRACDDVRSALADNCTSHALYRCSMTGKDAKIYLNILGSDLNGNLKEIEIVCDLEDGEVYLGDKVVLENEGVVSSAVYDMIVSFSEKLPFEVGIFGFPMEGEFNKGVIMEYAHERGTKMILIEDSMNFGYFND